MNDDYIPLTEALARGTSLVGDTALQQLLTAIEKGRVTAMCRSDGEWRAFNPKWAPYIARFQREDDPAHPVLATYGANGFRFDITGRNSAARRGILDVPDFALEIEIEAVGLGRLWPWPQVVSVPVPTGPKKRGPKPGTVTDTGYTKKDAALFPEIKRLMDEQNITLNKATLQLVEEGRVAGAGISDSRATRLRKAYTKHMQA